MVCLCVLSPDQTWSQDTTAATPVTETIVPSKEEIPFSVLQQIVSGFQFNGEIKTDLSKEQIDAMKKAQHSHYASSRELNQFSSSMFGAMPQAFTLRRVATVCMPTPDALLQVRNTEQPPSPTTRMAELVIRAVVGTDDCRSLRVCDRM